MSRFFAQLKITHRIYLLAAVAFVGIAMISGIFLFQRAADGEHRAVADTLSRAQSDVATLDINFLESRRHERDFLQGKDLGSVEKFAAQADEARAVIADLAGFVDSSTRAKLDTITKGYDAYIAAFDGLVEKNKALGLTPDEGLEGTMRDAVHGIEEQLKSISNDAVRANLLNLSRYKRTSSFAVTQSRLPHMQTRSRHLQDCLWTVLALQKRIAMSWMRSKTTPRLSRPMPN